MFAKYRGNKFKISLFVRIVPRIQVGDLFELDKNQISKSSQLKDMSVNV